MGPVWASYWASTGPRPGLEWAMFNLSTPIYIVEITMIVHNINIRRTVHIRRYTIHVAQYTYTSHTTRYKHTTHHTLHSMRIDPARYTLTHTPCTPHVRRYTHCAHYTPDATHHPYATRYTLYFTRSTLLDIWHTIYHTLHNTHHTLHIARHMLHSMRHAMFSALRLKLLFLEAFSFTQRL